MKRDVTLDVVDGDKGGWGIDRGGGGDTLTFLSPDGSGGGGGLGYSNFPLPRRNSNEPIQHLYLRTPLKIEQISTNLLVYTILNSDPSVLQCRHSTFLISCFPDNR